MEKPNTCNCCEGLSLETPVEVYNRPGLKAISYRVGDYSKFRESLLTSLSRLKRGVNGFPHTLALRGLTSRDNEDFTIGLLDAWAVVSDVLTFYQERIANESYLGTATEQLSIVELARLIGYELNPGVAASTMLAFTVEEASMKPSQAALTGMARGVEANSPIFLEVGTRVQSIPEQGEEPQNFETIEKIEARVEWNAMKPRMTQPYSNILENEIVAVKGLANNLKAGDVLLLRKENDSKRVKKIEEVKLDETLGLTFLYFSKEATFPSYQLAPNYSYSAMNAIKVLTQNFVATEVEKVWAGENFDAFLKTNSLAEDNVRNAFASQLAKKHVGNSVFVFRKQAAAFGHNAPKKVGFDGEDQPTSPATWTEWDLEENAGTLFLDAPYEQIVQGSYIAVRKGGEALADVAIYEPLTVAHYSRSAYGVSAKSTVLTLSPHDDWWGGGNSLSDIRDVSVYAQSEELLLANLPIETPISGLRVELERLYLGLKQGQALIVSGERADLTGVFVSEAKLLDKVEVVSGRTVLTLDKELEHEYVRKTFSVNANVARATHGESTREVLGSGDASQIFQRFTLKQPPLTFISAATPSGSLTTLEIRVNDLLWKEVPTLYGMGPNERIYITRQDDKGRTTVIFGNGKNGSRLPTGNENVTATYRKGIGANGLLKANQLTQLISRPLGVKAVTNPHPPTGAQDGEQLDNARQNATLTIFTLGRVVSLQDYEDFARAFAGIAKSLATWTWNGLRQEIYLTVAGVNGAQIDSSSDLYKNLLAGIMGASVPGTGVRIASYIPRFFRCAAKIKVLPEYLPEKVLKEIVDRLRAHFSFEARAFGQPVTKSEVISLIQNTTGVDWLDLDALYLNGHAVELNERLEAAIPGFGSSEPVSAELLTLDASLPQLTILS